MTSGATGSVIVFVCNSQSAPQVTDRYRLTTEDAARDRNFLGGCMALLCKGRAHHARLALAGTKWFAHLVRAADRAALSIAHETDHLVVSEGTG